MAEKITAYKGERGEMGEEEDLLFLLRHPEPPTPPPPATGYSTIFFGRSSSCPTLSPL